MKANCFGAVPVSSKRENSRAMDEGEAAAVQAFRDDLSRGIFGTEFDPTTKQGQAVQVLIEMTFSE